MLKKLQTASWFIKLFNWEYWPFNVVYGPIYFYWIWLMIKSRSVFFFNTSNPAITNGGFLMESKKDIYDLIPPAYYPPTLLFLPGSSVGLVLDQMSKKNIAFPVIAKPDIGMRGMLVQKLQSEKDLQNYINSTRVNFLVQDYIDYENEAGIFYYRIPGEAKGKISGIVGKELLTVVGDGTATIEALLMKDPRFILQLPVLKETHADTLQKVLQKEERHVLVPYGNHCRGSKFLDISDLIDEQLTTTIDTICQQVPEFYYGRMDIRYNTWEELQQGKNFSIIELNGAGSEPTHMYDPKHSIFFAWKEIIRHWNILYKISRINHQRKKLPYMNFAAGIKMLKENAAYVKSISIHLKQSV
jgi:hypothetical protein